MRRLVLRLRRHQCPRQGRTVHHRRPSLPYDGHTLQSQIAQVECLTGAKVERAYVDRGYRGHGLVAPQVYLSNTRGIASPTIKRELRRRSVNRQ